MAAQLLVNIDVDDLRRAEAFYRDALGLRPARRFDGVVEMLGGGAPIYLLTKAAGSRPAAAPAQVRDYRRHWTPVHLDFAVANLEAALRTAVAAGATQEGAVESHAWGAIAHCADPFGHGFCLIQFSDRGYDEING